MLFTVKPINPIQLTALLLGLFGVFNSSGANAFWGSPDNKCSEVKIKSIYSLTDAEGIVIEKVQVGNGIQIDLKTNKGSVRGVLTNAHVVMGQPREIRVSCGEEQKSFVIQFIDPLTDLALLTSGDFDENRDPEKTNIHSDLLEDARTLQGSLAPTVEPLLGADRYLDWSMISEDGATNPYYFFIGNSEFPKFLHSNLDPKMLARLDQVSQLYHFSKIENGSFYRLNNGIFIRTKEGKDQVIQIGPQQVESLKDNRTTPLITVEHPVLIRNFSAWKGLSGSPVFRSKEIEPDDTEFQWRDLVGLATLTELNGSSTLLIPRESILRFLERRGENNYFFQLTQTPELKNGALYFAEELRDKVSGSSILTLMCDSPIIDSKVGAKLGGDWGGGSGDGLSSHEGERTPSTQTRYLALPNFFSSALVTPNSFCGNPRLRVSDPLLGNREFRFLKLGNSVRAIRNLAILFDFMKENEIESREDLIRLLNKKGIRAENSESEAFVWYSNRLKGKKETSQIFIGEVRRFYGIKAWNEDLIDSLPLFVQSENPRTLSVRNKIELSKDQLTVTSTTDLKVAKGLLLIKSKLKWGELPNVETEVFSQDLDSMCRIPSERVVAALKDLNWIEVHIAPNDCVGNSLTLHLEFPMTSGIEP